MLETAPLRSIRSPELHLPTSRRLWIPPDMPIGRSTMTPLHLPFLAGLGIDPTRGDLSGHLKNARGFVLGDGCRVRLGGAAIAAQL